MRAFSTSLSGAQYKGSYMILVHIARMLASPSPCPKQRISAASYTLADGEWLRVVPESYIQYLDISLFKYMCKIASSDMCFLCLSILDWY